MAGIRALGCAAAALVATAGPAFAQAAPDQGIVVTGTRAQLSDWREAETEHVVVLSDGPERELVRIAHNLEKLHFLLSLLLQRTDRPDETRKLRVTLVGDTAEFDAMDLHNLRAAPGPYAPAFRVQRYYDPREDGAVMASTRIDQSATLEQGVSIASIAPLLAATMPQPPGDAGGGGVMPSASGMAQTSFGSSVDLGVQVNSVSVPVSAEGRVYAGYAQHFLLTHFPAPYPRWYVDGFGELFATLVARDDGVLEYGRPPEGIRRVLDHYRSVPVADVLTGRAVEEKDLAGRWTPFHAWALTHMLFFDDARRPQLRAYLLALANGAAPAEAVAAFGDLDALQRDYVRYGNRKVSYDRVTFPAERAQEPMVRRLTRGEAAFLKGRIELGSRTETPAAAAAGLQGKEADRAERERRDALAACDRWLRELREDAARYPADRGAQLLLAEAECRSGNADACLAAADRALALAPESSDALSWKGIAQVQQALAGPPALRQAQLRAARATIARANRLDTENPLPLLAYYRSFADAGETPPAIAVAGLRKVVDATPSSPGPRVMLGEALVRSGQTDAAKTVLLPVARGAYASPERARALSLLAQAGG